MKKTRYALKREIGGSETWKYSVTPFFSISSQFSGEKCFSLEDTFPSYNGFIYSFLNINISIKLIMYLYYSVNFSKNNDNFNLKILSLLRNQWKKANNPRRGGFGG